MWLIWFLIIFICMFVMVMDEGMVMIGFDMILEMGVFSFIFLVVILCFRFLLVIIFIG